MKKKIQFLNRPAVEIRWRLINELLTRCFLVFSHIKDYIHSCIAEPWMKTLLAVSEGKMITPAGMFTYIQGPFYIIQRMALQF